MKWYLYIRPNWVLQIDLDHSFKTIIQTAKETSQLELFLRSRRTQARALSNQTVIARWLKNDVTKRHKKSLGSKKQTFREDSFWKSEESWRLLIDAETHLQLLYTFWSVSNGQTLTAPLWSRLVVQQTSWDRDVSTWCNHQRKSTD